MVRHVRFSQYDIDATKSRSIRRIGDKLKLREREWYTDAEILFWIEVVDKQLHDQVEEYFVLLEEWYVAEERFHRNGAKEADRPAKAQKYGDMIAARNNFQSRLRVILRQRSGKNPRI